MRAYLFPGQGSQYPGMGRDLLALDPLAETRLDQASEILGYSIKSLLCDGSEEDLKATKVTQPAVFLYSVIWAEILGERFEPSMVAGHSLGEFSALTAAGALDFGDGLRLVALRAAAMQKACEEQPSTMAAVLGLDAGHLALGATADICIFDPEATWQLTPEALRSRGKNSPWLGYEMTGKVKSTLVGGRVVYTA